MFLFAVSTIIYGYSIFFLGVLHMLYAIPLGLLTILYGVILGFGIKKTVSFSVIKLTKFDYLVSFLLFLLLIINSIGVLGPELSFDALWYHLTFPKLYIQQHAISFIPGGLLYYSVMPKLGELLFIPAILWGSEIGAKGIQFIFGILTTAVVVTIARRYVSFSLALLAGLVFYSNIVVSWESTVAYIDLIRAFFETMAVWAFLLWIDTDKKKWISMCAVMTGAAISTKVLALGTMVLFTIVISIVLWSNHRKLSYYLSIVVLYWGISLLIPLPWFLFSYATTGNPFYPFFTAVYPIHSEHIQSVLAGILDLGKLFLFSDDPISPVYLISIPLVLVYFSSLKFQLKILGYYCVLALFVWFITPRTGGGRFILPYLSLWSILVIGILSAVKRQRLLYGTVVASIFVIATITIGYRGVANSRYLPVLTGNQTKQAFLSKHLNFSFGDFYDTDGYFKRNIKATDMVLLYGFHNLYYVDFPFIDSSWVKEGDTFTYVATQNTPLPKRFHNWEKIYHNPKTFVTLYKRGNSIWVY